MTCVNCGYVDTYVGPDGWIDTSAICIDCLEDALTGDS
jgi:hypothetical protein